MLAAVLGAFAAAFCTSSVALAQAGAPQVAPQGPTPNYRGIIAKSLHAKEKFGAENAEIPFFTSRRGIFPESAKIDHVQAADTIRMVQTNYFGWAWQTCIRLNLNGRPVTYAVFISEGRVVDARSALVVDNCERAQYSPLGGAALR